MKKLCYQWPLWSILQVLIVNKLAVISQSLDSILLQNKFDYYLSFQANIFPENKKRINQVMKGKKIFQLEALCEDDYDNVISIIDCSINTDDTSTEKCLKILLKFDKKEGLYFLINKIANIKRPSPMISTGDEINIENYEEILWILDLFNKEVETYKK